MVEQVGSLKTGVKYKDTPIGKIPVDWEVVRLGDVCDVIGGSTPSTKNKEYWGGDIPFATPTDITSLQGREISDTKRSITPAGLSSCGSRLLPAGSILLTSRATLGACAINTRPMATNQGFASLFCNERAYNRFIFYKMIALQRELDRLGSGSTFKEISKSNVRSLIFPLPPLPEQEKIAEILTTVDDAIEKTTQIVENAKEFKKGLMQKLFTEGIGHTEFKETKIGKIPEYWEVVQLSEILVGQKSTYGIYKERRLYGEGVPILKIGDVFQRDFYWGEKAKRVILSEKELLSNEVLVNDILIAVASVKQEGVGKVMYVSRLNEKTAFDHNLASIRTNSNKCNPKFLFYTLKSRIVRKKIESLLTKVGTTFLKASEIDKLLIPLPPLNEQRQVAEIFLEVDAEIEKEQTYKSELEKLKKGLMQVLLTGKLRVAA